MATQKLPFLTAYDPSDRSSDIKCDDPSLAQQQFKDEVDINSLLDKFKVTGRMPEAVRLPAYGDFSGVSDYQSAMNALLSAQDSFMSLPASIRDRFLNSPQRYLEFCTDPKNADELVSLGLAQKADLPLPAKPAVPAAGPAAPIEEPKT